MKTENNVATKYVYGLGLIYETTETDCKVYHYDYRGSTVALTETNGNVTDTFAYDTYGKLISHDGNTSTPFLYNGRDGVMTDENGLVYMRARYYSPTFKRFINADVVAGSITNAITLNRYAYANGNPVSNVDPFGLSPDKKMNSWEGDDYFANIPISTYKYGYILFNNTIYPIYVPGMRKGLFFESSQPWETVETLRINDVNIDWSNMFLQMFAGIELDDCNGMLDGTNPNAWQADLKGFGMYSVISGVLTSATNSVSNNVNNVYMKFLFQQRNGENRVIISAGSSQINNCVKSLNTGVIPNSMRQHIGPQNSSVLSKAYEEITHLKADPYKHYDIRVYLDPERLDSYYSSYIWIAGDGTIMEKPIIYSGDKAVLGTTDMFGIGFNKIKELPIGESAPASQYYQELLGKGIN